MKKYLILLITYFLISCNGLFAQLQANFTASSYSACAPAEIIFTNTTTGCAGNATYSWSSGNGDSSNGENPTFSYSTGGRFNVSLTVTCGGQSDTKVVEINISNSPTAYFEGEVRRECAPYSTSFSDLSTQGDLPITSWMWYFGDGGSSSQQNPTHVYNGTYVGNGFNSVSLKVTDANSCSHTFTRENLISVAKPPKVNFSADNPEWCVAPHSVTFTPEITSSFGLSYNLSWNFGDGSSSQSGNVVSHTYNSQGSFSVSLTAVDEYGCDSTYRIENYIQIKPAIPRYTIQRGPLVCRGENVIFRNITDYNCRWNFDNGSEISTQNMATYSFNTYGENPVTFTIDPGGVCEVDTTFFIIVEEVVASYTSSPTDTFSCSAPYIVEFQNTSSANATNFHYTFSPGLTSTAEDTIISFGAGTYRPRLIVTSNNGCVGGPYYGPPIRVINPKIGMVGNFFGCRPHRLNVRADSFNFPFSEVESWNWNFGDGTEIINGTSSASHTYNSLGAFTVTLTVRDINGCEISIDSIVSIGNPYLPLIDIIASGDTLCPQEEVIIRLEHNHDTCGFDCVYAYLFSSFGAERGGGRTLSEGDNIYMFSHDTGWVNMKLNVDHSGCNSVNLLPFSFYILPPILANGITKEFSCDDPLNYSIRIQPEGADYWDWRIYQIDEDTEESTDLYVENESTNEEIGFIFPGEGRYWTKVTAYNLNSGCIFRDSIPIEIAFTEAVIYSSFDKVCIDSTMIFYADSSKNALEFKWDFGDGSDETEWVMEPDTIDYVYPEGGRSYYAKLTVRGIDGCEDTDSVEVGIVKIDIAALTLDNRGCDSVTTTFINQTVVNDDISSIQWSFHDGMRLYGDTVSRDYLRVGSYNVTVTVNTEIGCSDFSVLWDEVVISTVNSAFETSTQSECTGNEILFEATETDQTYTYTWNFGNNDSIVSNQNNVSYAYEEGGIYPVSLSIDNNIGCKTNFLLEDNIVIEEPSGSFELIKDYYSCYPAELEVEADYRVKPPGTNVEFLWEMGNGDVSDTISPTYLYTKPGEYEISFSVITPNLCTSTDSHTVTIFGPYAEAEISPSSICLGEEVHFRMYDKSNVDEFIWVVGGGDSYEIEEFDHLYREVPPSGYYPVTLSIMSISADTCKVSILDNEKVYIHDVTAAFTITDSIHNEITDAKCSPLEIFLNNNSTGEIERTWYLNNQIQGNGEEVEKLIITNDGSDDRIFSLSLAVVSEQGCEDSISKNIEILALPSIHISNDTLICMGDEIMLNVMGGIKCEWSPDRYISDIHSYNPLVKPEDHIVYTARVENERLCSKTDSVLIRVQQKPEVEFNTENTKIIVGDSLVVSMTTNQDNMSYTWHPDYNISCLDCPDPYLFPYKPTTYFLVVEDSVQCFRNEFSVFIDVDEIYTLDVPMAFTPQSGDENSIAYVRGYGIKKLLQFRIYNRWGEEIFFSDNLNRGWDGHFNGKLQNMDNYSYFVEAEMYNGLKKTKKGHIMLIR